MELETQLNASDRNTRETISKNFQTIVQEDIDDDNARDQLNERVTKIENLLKTYGMTEEGTKWKLSVLIALGEPLLKKTIVAVILCWIHCFQTKMSHGLMRWVADKAMLDGSSTLLLWTMVIHVISQVRLLNFMLKMPKTSSKLFQPLTMCKMKNGDSFQCDSQRSYMKLLGLTKKPTLLLNKTAW